jgi:hypothetical protein
MARVDITAFVEGIVHEPTQTEGRGLDLTVADVHEITGPGRLRRWRTRTCRHRTVPIFSSLWYQSGVIGTASGWASLLG